MAKFAERLERLERAREEDGGIFLVVTSDGQPDEEALQEAMRKLGLTNRPRCPIFLSPIDLKL